VTRLKNAILSKISENLVIIIFIENFMPYL